MLTLGLETSGDAAGLALLEGDSLMACAELGQTGRRHARTLVSELRDLFAAHGRSPQQCACVAVSIGPGSFTGLRVGVVCAKTFAYAVGCPVVGVETLAAIAANAPEACPEVEVVLDALRGEWFHARYRRTEAGWRRIGEIAIARIEAVLADLPANVALTGPGLRKLPPQDLPPAAIPPDLWLPTARQIARLGAALVQQGHASDLWSLDPLYIRRSAPEERAAAAQSRS